MDTPPPDAQNLADHGHPILTRRDVALCLAMSKWIATAHAENAKGRALGYGPNWVPTEPDITKSRLFWRIRSGKEPLPEPPPTAYSCPWYEVVEEIDRGHWCYDDVHRRGDWVSIAQCPYNIEEWNDHGPIVVRFNCWRFSLWRGEKSVVAVTQKGTEERTLRGWWLQRIEADQATANATHTYA